MKISNIFGKDDEERNVCFLKIREQILTNHTVKAIITFVAKR